MKTGAWPALGGFALQGVSGLLLTCKAIRLHYPLRSGDSVVPPSVYFPEWVLVSGCCVLAL